MPRIKSVRAPQFKDWTEVDEALREIGEAEIALEELDAELTRKINEAKDALAPRTQSAHLRIKELAGLIEDFVEAHRDDFDGKKTRTMNFGEVGLRQSTTIGLPTDKDEYDEVIRRLRARKMDGCIVVTEKIDKEVLRQYGADVVRAVGGRWR